MKRLLIILFFATAVSAGTGYTVTRNDEAPFFEFIQLYDTPITYTGSGGLFVAVNVGATALEFIAIPSHVHDGDTLELDGIDSDGGAFSFDTTGDVTFNQSIEAASLTITTSGGGFLLLESGDLLLKESDSGFLEFESTAAVNQVLYLNAVGTLTYEAGFEYDPDTDTLTVEIITIGNELDLNDNRIDNISDLNFNSATELTISSGAVTATQGHHSIDTEADATDDDLDTINGGESGDILLILPADDGHTVRIRNGVGNIFLKHQVESKSYSFSSPSGSSGIFYAGGYYNWEATDGNLTQASLSVTHSAANVSSACHIGIVAGGAGVVDTGVVKLTATGTTIDDEANRATSQTITLVADITTLGVNDYVETTEKFLGQVTIALAVASGSPVNFSLDLNYGCSKYEDFGNQAFTITVVEIVGLAGANDSGFNLRLFHHSTADWTYAASGFVPGGTVLASMNTDHGAEQDLANGESFAYKRVDLNTDVSGDNGEGLVLEITTSANKAVEIMDLHLGVHTAPNFAYLATTKQHLIFMKHGPNWLEL